MRLLLLAAAGGALGSAARYLVNVGSLRAWGPAFPWSTLIVNAVGCFAIGLLAELIAARLGNSAAWRTFLLTGILGGFTTFSAFALDFADLIERQAYVPAMLYLTASLSVTLLGVYLGLALARALLH